MRWWRAVLKRPPPINSGAGCRGRWCWPGLFFLFLDFVLGYNNSLFMLLCLGWWGVAFVVWLALRRNRAGGPLAPDYATAREVFHTLRDDVAPKKFFFGHLDLTGPRQTSKVARTAQNALGRNVSYYRDEWLSLKAKLYDGNMLRVSAIQRMKVRDSYTKRSASGKLKMKSALVKDDRQHAECAPVGESAGV